MGAGELALCSLAIEAPLLLPQPRPKAAADTVLHVVLGLREGGVRLQSSAQERRCESFPLQSCHVGLRLFALTCVQTVAMCHLHLID